MTHYTVCCGYASHYHNTVTVEAGTLGEALEKAIEQAGDDPHWKSVDQASQTFVEALAEGVDADPWGDTAIPVPDRFTGEPANATGGCESRMAVMSAAWFVEFRQRLPWLQHVD